MKRKKIQKDRKRHYDRGEERQMEIEKGGQRGDT